MRIEYLPRKEYEERFEPSSLGTHRTEEGEHIIYLPKGASTRTRMHEIAHAELGHETPKDRPLTFSESAKRELAADDWVYRKLGREPSFNEILMDFEGMIGECLDKGYSVSQTFNWIMKELEDFGYDISKEEKSEIWWIIRETKSRRRGK